MSTVNHCDVLTSVVFALDGISFQARTLLLGLLVSKIASANLKAHWTFIPASKRPGYSTTFSATSHLLRVPNSLPIGFPKF